MTRHIQLRAGRSPAIDDSPNWPNQVRVIYRDHARELRFAAWKLRAMGFRITRVTLDRLAYRLACNGRDWKRAATREAVYRFGLALDVEYGASAMQCPLIGA
jgi:hypothetical protein